MPCQSARVAIAFWIRLTFFPVHFIRQDTALEFTGEKCVESLSGGFHAVLIQQSVNAHKAILAKADDLFGRNLQGLLLPDEGRRISIVAAVYRQNAFKTLTINLRFILR